MRAYGNRILVERLNPELKSAGGLHLPENTQAPNRGKVVSIGDEVGDLNVGDVVRFLHTEQQIPFLGKMLCVVKADLITVVEEGDDSGN